MKTLTALLALSACAITLNGQATKSLEICGMPFHLGMTRDEVKQQVWDDVKQQTPLTRDLVLQVAGLQKDTVVIDSWTLVARL